MTTNCKTIIYQAIADAINAMEGHVAKLTIKKGELRTIVVKEAAPPVDEYSPPTKRVISKVQDPDRHELLVDGSNNYFLTITEEWRRGHRRYGFGSRPNGKLRIKAGSYSSTTSFPERKDGSHNYAEIAKLLVDAVERNKESLNAEQTRQLNIPVAQKLRKELGLATWGDVQIEASQMRDKPVYIVIKKTILVTPDRAREIVAALKSCKLV